MNHRPSWRGYHSSLWHGVPLLALLAAGCALLPASAKLPAATPTVAPVPAVPTGEWQAAKAATLAAINAARADAGLGPVAWDATLERVGDAFCAALLAEAGLGHVAADGVPPYLRALLAGENGFHRENVASYDSSAGVDLEEVEGIALVMLASMLAETPPDDGHRRTILEPTATHLGVGVAVLGGSVRVAHEMSSRGAVAWRPPTLVVRPFDAARLGGRLARPWRPTGVEVLWEPLPEPRAPGTPPVRTYAYPPVRSFTSGSTSGLGPLGFTRPDDAASLKLDGDAFTFVWKAGAGPGVETIVVWARRNASERALTPIASAATVVTPDGTLPPALQKWAALRTP
ncbi:MAG: hypothetical protein HY825_06135 [Acidobacteria bacterium]|nr:hypothetical protein [Acidobacteriota bacterium]